MDEGNSMECLVIIDPVFAEVTSSEQINLPRYFDKRNVCSSRFSNNQWLDILNAKFYSFHIHPTHYIVPFIFSQILSILTSTRLSIQRFSTLFQCCMVISSYNGHCMCVGSNCRPYFTAVSSITNLH